MTNTDTRTSEPGITKRTKNGRITYRLRIMRDGVKGTQTFATFALALKRKHEILATYEQLENQKHDPTARPLEAFIELYLATKQCTERHKGEIRRYLDWWLKQLEGKPVSQIDVRLIEACLARVEHASTGKPIGAETWRKYLFALSGLLSWLVRRGDLAANPCLGVSKPKLGPAFDRVLTEAEIERLLQACQKSESKGLYLLVKLALETGCRQNELLTLKWRNVNLQARELTLEAADTKTKRGRCLPIGEESASLLKGLVSLHKETVFNPNWYTYRRAWRNAVKAANIAPYKFHGLRHQAITRWARSGLFTLPEIMQLSGHTTLTCLLRYQHLMPGAAKDKARGLL